MKLIINIKQNRHHRISILCRVNLYLINNLYQAKLKKKFILSLKKLKIDKIKFKLINKYNQFI